MLEQQLIDQMLIRNLLVEYAEIIDTKRFDELPRVFTEDADIDYSAFGGIKGNVAEIIDFLKTSMAQFVRHQHMLGNSALAIDGDTASGRTQCHNPMITAVEGGGEHVMFLGFWYVDTFVRHADEWKITTRSQQMCYVHNAPAAMQL